MAVPRQNSGSTELHPFNNVTGCAQAVDFKVGHHFGEGQPEFELTQDVGEGAGFDC
jgi:hypothetical protein